MKSQRTATVAVVLMATAVIAPPSPARAAATTITPATVIASDFTFRCSADTAGRLVARSWRAADGTVGQDTSAVVPAGGQVSQFRDGAPHETYQYRCLLYDADTGALIARTPTALVATTTGDTRFGILVNTNGDPGGNTFSNYVALYHDHRARFGGKTIGVRLFSGGSLPSPAGTDQNGRILAWVAANHTEEKVAISFKTWDSAAPGRMNTLMDWAQAHRIELQFIYFHEVNDDWCRNSVAAAEPSYYKSVYVSMRQVRDAHPYAAGVTLNKNFNDYWQRYHAASRGCDWSRYIVPKDPATAAKRDPADMISWDLYPSKGYYSAAESLKFAYASSTAAALPWALGELGASEYYGSPVSGMAAWEKSVTDAARDAASVYPGWRDAEFVWWWCAYGAAGTIENNHLERSPSAVTDFAAKVSARPFH